MCVYMCTGCICDAHRSQKLVSEPLNWSLRWLSIIVGAGSEIQKFHLQNMYVRACLCVCVMHMYVCILGEGTWVYHGAHKNVRGQSLPLWDRSLVSKHSRLGGPSVPRSSVSTFHLARKHLGLQIHAAMSGFMWVLRNPNSSSACVAILYPMNHLILKSQSTVNKTSSQWPFLSLFFFCLCVCVCARAYGSTGSWTWSDMHETPVLYYWAYIVSI